MDERLPNEREILEWLAQYLEVKPSERLMPGVRTLWWGRPGSQYGIMSEGNSYRDMILAEFEAIIAGAKKCLEAPDSASEERK